MVAVAQEYIAPRYATRFHCIGAECEETCCSGWEVPVDEKHYARLEQKMQGTLEERDEFHSGFASPPTSVDGKGKHALVVLKEDGGCHFLSEDRLCSVQKRYGTDVLSDTCATYPRQVKLVGDRIELTAKVSCPEVARLLLLVPDACEVVEIGPELLERRILHDALEPATADHYAAAFDEVRSAITRLLMQSRFPLASRLAFVGCLADALSPILYRGVPHRDPPARARALSSFQSSAVLAQLHQEFSQIAVPDATAASLVMRVLGSRMGSRGSLGELVTRIFADPRAPSASPDAAGMGKLEPHRAEELLACYRQSKRAWEPKFASTIEAYFTNYVLNYVTQEWFTNSRNLAVYAQNLFLRVAALRFLLFTHPDVAQFAHDAHHAHHAHHDGGVTDHARAALLDRVAVEVFYKFTRGIEHNPAFVRRIEADLEEKVTSFEHAMFLIKF